MPPLYFHLIQKGTSIQAYHLNIFLKGRGANTPPNAVYACEYSKAEQAKGNNVSECDTVCQQKAQVSSHIRQFHLGNCIACYLCDHRWWSAWEWRKHMKENHSALSEEAWYVAEGDPSERLVIKTEVTEEADD